MYSRFGRRFSGQTIDNESNKAGIFILEDARLGVAFTGPVQNEALVITALLDSAEPDFQMVSTIQRFCDQATRDFCEIKVPKKSDKRLTIVIIGCAYNETPPRWYYWRISNFDVSDSRSSVPAPEPLNKFRIRWYRERRPSDNADLIFTAPINAAVTDTHKNSHRKL